MSSRRENLLAELEKHVDYLDVNSVILWAVVRAFAAEAEELRGLLDELRNARPLLLYGDKWIERIDAVLATPKT